METSNNISNTLDLHIVTYNCRSVKNSVGAVKNLCLNNDIILLQEHWLMPDELNFLSYINPDFVFFGSSAVKVNESILCGRPYGGIAILCRRNLVDCVKAIKYNNPRVTAIELSVIINGVQNTIVIASIYMPVDVCAGQTDEDFEFVCGYLDALVLESHVNGYIFAGDFNFRHQSSRSKFILNSLAHHNATIADEHTMDSSSFTYISDCHNTTSWIDHVITNQNMLSSVSNMSVLYGVVSSDHRPLRFCLTTNIVLPSDTSNTKINNIDTLHVTSDWAKCSQSDLYNYSNHLDQ
jgi:exonuclease III